MRRGRWRFLGAERRILEVERENLSAFPMCQCVLTFVSSRTSGFIWVPGCGAFVQRGPLPIAERALESYKPAFLTPLIKHCGSSSPTLGRLKFVTPEQYILTS